MTATTSEEKVANSVTTNRYNKLSSKKGTLRWRSTGWTPLAYPSSALVNNENTTTTGNQNCESNPFFPLDKDVLRAAMREMLILQGSIDSKTLELKNERRMRFHHQSCDTQTTSLCNAPSYALHVDPRLIPVVVKKETASLESEGSTGKKRKLPVSPDKYQRRKTKKRPPSAQPSIDEKAIHNFNPESDAHIEELKMSVSCAEELIDLIVDRARVLNDSCSFVEPLPSSTDVKEEELYNAVRLLRKVSDADQPTVANNTDQPPVLLDLAEETCGDQDISLFVDIHNRKDDGSFSLLKSEIPSFLDVSIVFESFLRVGAYRMVSKMCQTFDDDAIRWFLGYKSCALKRQRVLRILSDYLFDVSHALFAWKQTESEILSEQDARPSLASFYRQVDTLVSDSLFDQRALKKIGGLDDSSILRHAIEISRCERKHESWNQFSKTATGRRLLSHHWATGRARLVGQKRRGQRIKRVAAQSRSAVPTLSDASDDTALPRSRASSIVSCDESVLAAEYQNRGVAPEVTTTSQAIHEVFTATYTPSSPQIQNLSEVLDLILTRAMGKSWGVLLSKEGDHCVVDRAPNGSSLRCGDMILSVKDGTTGDEWKPCSNMNPEWFKEIVGFFRGSYELHLVVRRVGC